MSAWTIASLTRPGIDNRYLRCVWLKLAPDRPHLVAPVAMAADVMPGPCVYRSLVLSRITSMVQPDPASKYRHLFSNSIRLIGKDRVEEARIVVASLHADGDVNHPLVNLQIEEMSESLREEGIMTWRKFFDMRVLFSTRAKRYRLMLSKLAAVSFNPKGFGLKSTKLDGIWCRRVPWLQKSFFETPY